MTDAYYNNDLTAPAGNAAAINLGADTTYTAGEPRGLFIGTGGNVKVDLVNGATGIVFKNLTAGQILPVRCTKIYSTANGTTAADIVALF